MALTLCNLLIELRTIDWQYLKQHTNSAFLVQEDGYFYRVDGREQIWDAASGGAKPL